MYVMNKKWDSITNIAQCTSVYVSPEHEIKAVPTGGGAVYFDWLCLPDAE